VSFAAGSGCQWSVQLTQSQDDLSVTIIASVFVLLLRAFASRHMKGTIKYSVQALKEKLEVLFCPVRPDFGKSSVFCKARSSFCSESL
jgi:hypothetical protein